RGVPHLAVGGGEDGVDGAALVVRRNEPVRVRVRRLKLRTAGPARAIDDADQVAAGGVVGVANPRAGAGLLGAVNAVRAVAVQGYARPTGAAHAGRVAVGVLG